MAANYFRCVVEFIIRDCQDHQEAREAVMRMLPQDPDRDCAYIESWLLFQIHRLGDDKMIRYEDISETGRKA
jgi:hypothetical protein